MNTEEAKKEQDRRVQAFAAAMIDRLTEKVADPDKTFLGWELDEINGTFVHLAKEVGSVAKALRDPEGGLVFIECVDVACMAFILADLVALETEPGEASDL